MREMIVIKPKKRFDLNIRELWAFRELFFALAVRDIKVRYKQTIIGILWAVLQPFLLMIVFTVFFGRIAGVKTTGIPYPIFVYSGLLFWNFFSNSLSAASESMIASQAIVQKIYFPRVILPISSTIVFLVDFAFSSLIFFGMLVYYGFTPSLLGCLLIIPALFVTASTFLGLGLFFAAVNVKYRDVRYVLPFFTQLLLFVTPVIYPTAILGEYRWLWYLNPMSGVIDIIRNSFLHIGTIDWNLFGASAIAGFFLFAFGLYYFNKTEKYFADLI